uniref:Putative secreted protein n=1 Tax=Anopheles darlingi TaxID=43151 RepID=A0A2M4DHY2_ANODA
MLCSKPFSVPNCIVLGLAGGGADARSNDATRLSSCSLFWCSTEDSLRSQSSISASSSAISVTDLCCPAFILSSKQQRPFFGFVTTSVQKSITIVAFASTCFSSLCSSRMYVPSISWRR